MIDMNEIYNKHYAQIYGHVYKMVNNKEDAEDLSQDIFVKIYQKIDQYNASRSFVNWILRIAQNHCTDFYRKKQREYKIFNTEIDLDSTLPFYHESYTEPELYGKYRVIYALKKVCGLKSKEIAEICGIPVPTAVWIIRRAKNDLESRRDK